MRRSSASFVIVAVVVSAASLHADALTFSRARARATSQTTVTVYVSTNGGDAPAGVDSLCLWSIAAQQDSTVRVVSNRGADGACLARGPIQSARYRSGATETHQMELQIAATAVAGIDLQKSHWTVVFTGPSQLIATPAADDDDSGVLDKADSKDDADLYFSGGYTGAKNSAPIWTIDAKWALPVYPHGKDYHWLSVTGSASLNPDPAPPADSSDMNPDSVTFSFQMDKSFAPQAGPLTLITAILKPVGGEYAKDPNSGNVIAAGQLSTYSRGLFNNTLFIDPFVGFEAGKNLSKPTVLFKKPVDLTDFNGIARALYGATVNFYVFQPKISPRQIYRFVLTLSWQGRALGTQEPYVKSVYEADDSGVVTHQKTLNLQKGTRNYFEGDFSWNATKLFGVALKYKRGSLPPLFKFVDSEVSVQLTFKAKFTNPETAPAP